MNYKLILFGVLLVLGEVVGPPVTQQKKKDGEDENSENEVGNGDNDQMGPLGIEYDRYLKEVVTALESDPEFREKLEKAEEVDIRTGKIAQELEYVNHNVRTKLDELKRQELERLRQLTAGKNEKNEDDPHHLDHKNPHTFEVEDLVRLIAKTTADLAEADRKRRTEFKEYEMQKKFEQEQRLNAASTEEKRHEMENELKKLEEKHKKHEPLHHPGSKQQLEEVWEKQDHMENQDFDPKTFFYLHDLDGNGAWDEEEVKALFLKELDKLYQAGAPEDDMRERREEMERMREHVFAEADVNKDGFISFQEFLQQTQKPDFEKDDGWQGLDEQQMYSPDEYAAFEQRRQQEIQRMIQQGLIPPHPQGLSPPLPPGHPGQFQQPQHFPSGHPNQIPQGHVPQGSQGQFHPGQVPQAQYHPQQGQYQVHPGQVPQTQFHPGQVAQGQYHHPGQVPQQGQYHPGQPQYHPNQVPQGQFQQRQQPQGQQPQVQGQFQQGQHPQGQQPQVQGQFQQGQHPQGQQSQEHGQFQQGQHPQGPKSQEHGQFQQGEHPQGQPQGQGQFNSQGQGHGQGQAPPQPVPQPPQPPQQPPTAQQQPQGLQPPQGQQPPQPPQPQQPPQPAQPQQQPQAPAQPASYVEGQHAQQAQGQNQPASSNQKA